MYIHVFWYQYSKHDTLEGLLTQLKLLVLSFWLFPFGSKLQCIHSTHILYYLYFALFFQHIHQREMVFYWKNESVWYGWYGMVQCNILFSFFAYFEWKVGCCCQMLTHAPFSLSSMYEKLVFMLICSIVVTFATFSLFIF